MSSRQEWADALRHVGECAIGMADAMDDDDDIAGAIWGGGLAEALPRLPQHIREVFLDHLSDEAVAGVKTDDRYFAATEAAP